MTTPNLCTCGVPVGTDPHPCHYNGYTCRKPAKARFYCTSASSALAGAQMKTCVRGTYACDACWCLFHVDNATQLLSGRFQVLVGGVAVPVRLIEIDGKACVPDEYLPVYHLRNEFDGSRIVLGRSQLLKQLVLP